MEKEKLDFLWNTHRYINDYIRLADAKAMGLLATFGAFLGIVVGRKPEFATDVHSLFVTVSVVSSAVAMGFAAYAVFPRTRGDGQGMIYWQNIQNQSVDGFLKATLTASETDRLTELTRHTHQLAKVAQQKYDLLQLAFGG